MTKATARANATTARTAGAYEKKLTTAIKSADSLQEKLTEIVVESRGVYASTKDASAGFQRVLEGVGTMSDATVSARKSEMLAIYKADAGLDLTGMQLKHAVKKVREANPGKARKPRTPDTKAALKGKAGPAVNNLTGLQLLELAHKKLAAEATDEGAKELIGDLLLLSRMIGDALAQGTSEATRLKKALTDKPAVVVNRRKAGEKKAA